MTNHDIRAIAKRPTRRALKGIAIIVAIAAISGVLAPRWGLPGPARAASLADSGKAGIAWDAHSLHLVYRPSNGLGRHYAYAPSVLLDAQGELIWTCHNDASGVIRDHIYYTYSRNGALQSRSVLSAGPAGAWDSFHTCDPSVVQASLSFRGQRFKYLMAYLGNDVNASAHNQIGLAAASSVDGPWTKLGAPVVTAVDDGTWGVGQPSLVALDGTHFMLFYTDGNSFHTGGFWRLLDLTNAARPKVGIAVAITDAGLSASDGNLDYLNNFDVAFAPTIDRFYAVREQHPYPSGRPGYIGASLQVVSISGRDLRSGGGAWRVEGEINPDLTGFPRNHNAGLVRNALGYIPDSHSLSVVFTRACTDTPDYNCSTPEWSYDLWEITGRLP